MRHLNKAPFTKILSFVTESSKFQKILLGASIFVAGTQSAWASCAGTVYFKAPSDWTQAVFSGQNNYNAPVIVKTRDENGYFIVNLADIGLDSYVTKFSIANKSGQNNIIVTDTAWNYQNAYDSYGLQNMAFRERPLIILV